MTERLTDRVAGEVRAELARQRLTHREVAARLGLSQPQFSRRASGVIDFRVGELERLAEILGVPLSRFMDRGAA